MRASPTDDKAAYDDSGPANEPFVLDWILTTRKARTKKRALHMEAHYAAYARLLISHIQASIILCSAAFPAVTSPLRLVSQVFHPVKTAGLHHTFTINRLPVFLH